MRPTIILIADDDPSISELLQAEFQAEGWQSCSAFDGDQTVKLVHENDPDLVVLDIGMPGINGIEVCRHITAVSDIPVIMLTARRDDETRQRCLSLGAEGYITKPFRTKDLIEQMKAVQLRRRSNNPYLQRPLVTGHLEIDFATEKVTRKGVDLKLEPTEYHLLEELAGNAGKTLKTKYLLNKVWGPRYSDEKKYVHDYIDKLREKIEPRPDNPIYVITVPGVGYRFEARGKGQDWRLSTGD